MQRLIEVLAVSVFRYAYGYNLVNLNQIRMNFPAIDLADENKKVSVQVTTNASAQKINKTIKTYEAHDLRKDYDKLFIFGFCNAKKPKSLPSYCNIVDMSDIINNTTNNCSNEELQNLCDAIRRHQDYRRLHPWDDKNCLEILLNNIDRNAIKHRMSCEGNIDDMLKGLKEISELIGKGTIDGKVKSKCLDDFHDEDMIRFMRSIKDMIAEISAIVNRGRMSGSVFSCIELPGMMEIDQIKENIAKLTNEIAKMKDISINIKLRK
ncbi:hypothetical protein [Azospirillum argentinense]